MNCAQFEVHSAQWTVNTALCTVSMCPVLLTETALAIVGDHGVKEGVRGPAGTGEPGRSRSREKINLKKIKKNKGEDNK